MLAVAIVAAAFAAGYGGRLLLAGDDDGGLTEITAEQAQSVPLEISRGQLEKRLEGASPVTARTLPESHDRCLYYAITAHPNDAWAFCFRQGKLTSSVLQSASAGG
jgi:hypothetical protein